MPMEPERARDLLARERARIERSLTDLASDGEGDELSHLDQHMGETDLFDEERDAGLADRLRQELDAVQRAEKRLADGTYGRSVVSGDPIPDARLEIVPQADRTVEEQARIDHT